MARQSMTTDGLRSVKAKIARAAMHADTLQKSIAEFFGDEDSYHVWFEGDSDRPEGSLMGQFLKRPNFPYWGVVFGDVVHCLRSALDHIAWQCTINRQTAPDPIPDRGEWRRVAYPILTDSTRWDDNFARKLWGVPDMEALFKAQQPFSTRPEAPEQEPLAMLEGLWNIDKHRHIHFADVQVRLEDVTFEWRGTGRPIRARVLSQCLHEGWALEDSAPLADVRFLEPVPADRYGEMDVNRQLASHVILEEGPPAFGEYVLKAIALMTTDVWRVVAEFQEELGPEIFNAPERGHESAPR